MEPASSYNCSVKPFSMLVRCEGGIASPPALRGAKHIADERKRAAATQGAGRITVQAGAGDVLEIQHSRFQKRIEKSVSRVAARQWARVAVRRAVFLSLLLALIFAPFAIGVAMGDSMGATQTALTVNADNSGPRTTVTLNAHVEPLSGMDVPAGVVTFRTGASELGSAVLDSNGDAALTTNNLPAGSHHVIAIYRGDSTFQGSISPSAEAAAAQSDVAGFILAATPSTMTVPVGSIASTTIAVTPVNGFNAYVSLSCSGLPPGATCSFSPDSVLAACTTSGSTTSCPAGYSTMQIQTLAPSAELNMPAGSGHGWPVYAILFPAFFGVAGVGARKKRKVWNAVLLVLLFAGAMSLTACNVRYNYFHHGPTTNKGTPTGTYTVTVNSVSTQGSLITTPPTSPQIALTVTGQ